MTTWKILGAAALALATAACGQKQDDFADATPDAAGLALELAGGAPEGIAADPGAPLGLVASVTPVPDVADELGAARASLRALNAEVRRVLEQVAAVAQQPPTSELGDVKVYGPADRCVQDDGAGGCRASANLRLAIRHHYLRVYSWVLQARPVGSTDPAAFKPVLAGWMARNAEAHRGRGRAAFDLDNLRAAAPGYTGQGDLLVGFGHAGAARTLAYRLLQFTPDATRLEPVTAGFVGHVTPAGVRRVRVATFADLVPGGSPLPRELELGHLAWLPGVGGRGHLVISNWSDSAGAVHGDVPTAGTTDHYYFGRACWAAGGGLLVKEWYFCARADGPVACMADPASRLASATLPAGATWSDCPAVNPAVALPGAVAPGDELGTGEEPAPGADAPPAPQAPPADPGDVDPPPAT